MTEPTRQVKYVTRPGVKVVRYAGHDNYDQFYLDGHSAAYGWGVPHAAFDALFQPIEEPEPVGVCAYCHKACSGTGGNLCPEFAVREAREAGIREVIAWMRENNYEDWVLKASITETHFFPTDAERLRGIAAGLPSGDGWDSTAAIILEIADRMDMVK